MIDSTEMKFGVVMPDGGWGREEPLSLHEAIDYLKKASKSSGRESGITYGMAIYKNDEMLWAFEWADNYKKIKHYGQEFCDAPDTAEETIESFLRALAEGAK